MNKHIRQFERESNIDVYGLGLDRVKWEAAMERFAQLIVFECGEFCGQVDRDAMFKHFGVES